MHQASWMHNEQEFHYECSVNGLQYEWLSPSLRLSNSKLYGVNPLAQRFDAMVSVDLLVDLGSR